MSFILHQITLVFLHAESGLMIAQRPSLQRMARLLQGSSSCHTELSLCAHGCHPYKSDGVWITSHQACTPREVQHLVAVAGGQYRQALQCSHLSHCCQPQLVDSTDANIWSPRNQRGGFKEGEQGALPVVLGCRARTCPDTLWPFVSVPCLHCCCHRSGSEAVSPLPASGPADCARIQALTLPLMSASA